MKIAFVGFNRTESRLLMLKRYKLWEYDKVLDSAQLTYAGDQPYNPNKPDTLWLSEYKSDGLIRDIYHGNDWQIIILGSASRSYLITEINQSEHISELISCTDNKTTCENPMIYFKFNGDITDGSTLYIVKPLK